MTRHLLSAARKSVSQRRFRRGSLAIAAAISLLMTLSAVAFQQAGTRNPAGSQQQGTRSAGVQPKRNGKLAPARDAKKERPGSAASRLGLNPDNPIGVAETIQTNSILKNLLPVLATADFDLIGLAVTANPATQTVPKNTPTSILTGVQVPAGSDQAAVISGLNPNFRVRGELTGASFNAPILLEAAIGQPLKIPQLTRAGEHVVQNLRVVDISAEGQPVVAAVTPDACGIVVIERLLISEVRVNELTYDQIIQAGINITDDSYQAFNFTLGLATSSDAQTIQIPVAFPSVGVTDPRPIVGIPTISAPGIDAPTIIPVLLETETGDGGEGDGGTPPEFGGEPVRIPGVIVFPGRVGFLHQFFEAIVIVANGAPNGTPLVVRNLKAKALLPDGGTIDLSDDPLRIAETQAGGRISELELHGLGADGRYGTADDTNSFQPGQSGQATFLLEGLKEGLHTVNFNLEATLDGLPGGAVQVRGSVPGAVLVRDASFAVTFTHPSVVRAGQDYDLAMTMYNSGSRDIQGAFARLARNSISGASLIGQDTGERSFDDTIKRGESATIKWRLRSHTTGAVTASYVKVGEGVTAGLALSTGVGDRNIPLSPDSLILPDPVRHLPAGVVEAARSVLGQAWSIANAPSGSLPAGVLPITKQGVIDRAVELGIAGMRVDFNEPVSVSLETLMRDWLGELQAAPDSGFADTIRNTPSGYGWYDSIGVELHKHLTSGVTPSDLHRELAATESSRSGFISALVTHADGEAVTGARLVDAQNQKLGFGTSAQDRAGDLQQGGALPLNQLDPYTGAVTSTLGQLLVASNPGTGTWTLELTGWRTGTANVSVLVPLNSRTYRQLTWDNVAIEQGRKYRVTFKANSTATPALEEEANGAYRTTNLIANVTTLDQAAPRLVGVVQVTPDVIPGGDKYGRLIGLLFSKPMTRTTAETVSRYTLGGGTLKNSSEQVGTEIKVTGARLDYGDRFVFLGLGSPIGRYIDRNITVANLSDARRMPLNPAPVNVRVDTRVSLEGRPPGAYLTGRVMGADGTPVPNAEVIYWVQECPDPRSVGLPPPPKPIAISRTDAQGKYEIDYVRDGDCGSLFVSVMNPITKSEKRLGSPVAYDGQHMIFDMVFLARGNVGGLVTSGGRPMPKAFVRVVPDLDAVGTKVVQADDNGRYLAKDVPVGNISVLAVGFGVAQNASGFAAGTIEGSGLTANIDVALQNITGAVGGRVVRADSAPAAGALVVAYARIPGFGSLRFDGALAVGYSYSDRDGNFRIENLPVGDISLEITDALTGMQTAQRVQLTTAAPEVTGVLMTLSGFGTVTGRITDELGNPIAQAFVSSAGRGVRADDAGNYTLQNMPAGTHTVTASQSSTGMTGAAIAGVRLGETTSNINVAIARPATLQGRVMIVEEGSTTPKPLAGAQVSADGYRIVTTNAEGRYTLTNVITSADLTLRFVESRKNLVVNMPVFLTPGETLTRDATFRPATVRGRVFQPDGVTGTIAQLNVFVERPETTPGGWWGTIRSDLPSTTQSAPDGSYNLSGLNPGKFRISTSNAFFPTPVSVGGLLSPSSTAERDITLVSTLTGKIQGRVSQPDGTTPVGANIRVTLGGGSLADATVLTDETGHYEFGEVFSAGGYTLTAVDPGNGNTNRISIQTQRNQDAIGNIRLLGTGNLRVRVLDGAGNPAQTGSISLDGSNYPNAHRYVEITPGNNGSFAFDNLPEGSYAVAATQNGLGGRIAAIVPNGETIEVTIYLQPSGTIEGRVTMPGGVAPRGLADVELRLNGRSVGFTVTADTDADRGAFRFASVPAGDFTLDVFDNRTGRVGRSSGRIETQGQIETVNVELLPIGAVSGRVTMNNEPVDHALVEISADGSGVRGARAVATTSPDGRFRFTGIPIGNFQIRVTEAPGGQGGTTTGKVEGTIEPLADTIADVVLAPSVSVAGAVYKLGGAEKVKGAQVTVSVGGRTFHTATNDNGNYSLAYIPLGEVRVRAESPNGFDRGEAAPVAATQGGATVTANVTLAGTGTISGTALDNAGAPLTAGTVTFTNDAWGTPIVIIAAVQSDGRFEFTGLPVGQCALRLQVPNRTGTGTGTFDVAAQVTTNATLRLEDAGKVTGTVTGGADSAPVAGSDVVMTLSRQSGSLRFYAHTDSQGSFSFDNVPLGSVSLSIYDPATNGVARIKDAALSSNGQTLDLGSIALDSTPIEIEAVEPANGSTGVSATSIAVTFSEAASPNSINQESIYLSRGTVHVPSSVTLTNGNRTATITPATGLADSTAYTIVVTNGIEDATNHPLAVEFRSTFITGDINGPAVVGITPQDNAIQIATDAGIAVTFNEPLNREQDLASIVVVKRAGESVNLTGTVALDNTNRVVLFTPSSPLQESKRYVVTVTGQRDAAGNTRADVANFSFTTIDRARPTVYWQQPANGSVSYATRPAFEASYDDEATGIDASRVTLTLDNVNVTANAQITNSRLTYQPTQPLAKGSHTATIRVADVVGNLSDEITTTFTVDDAVAITQVSPDFGAITGGTFVRIKGSGLINSDDTMPTVWFGGSPARVEPNYSYWDSDCYRVSCLKVYAPAHAAGTVNVEVRTDHGTATLAAAYTYAVDVTPPEVVGVTPAEDAIQVASDARVVVQFNEPLDPAQDLNSVIEVYNSATGARSTGNVALDETGASAIFTPAEPFAEDQRYAIYIHTFTDLAGNTRYYFDYLSFATIDHIAPTVPYMAANDAELEGAEVHSFTPQLEVHYQDDNGSAIDVDSVKLFVDGVQVQPQTTYWYFAEYRPTTALALGAHTLKVVVADRAGNSFERTATFTVTGDDPPVITSYAIANRAAFNGMTLTQRRPAFYIQYADDAGINVAATKLLIGAQGGEPQQVAANVYGSALSYEPTGDFADGSYLARLIVTDKVGSTTTRDINFQIGATDTTPPSVTGIAPADYERDVPLNSSVVVTFSEPLDPTQNFSQVVIVKVNLGWSGYRTIPGTVRLDQTGRVATYTPTGGFESNTNYLVDVIRPKDAAGNVQQIVFGSTFASADVTPPTIGDFSVRYRPIDGARIPFSKPEIQINLSDGGTGIDCSTLVVNFDGAKVTRGVGCGSYQPPAPLTNGLHTITAQVKDNAGNVSAVRQATFTVDTSAQLLNVTPASGSKFGGTRVQLEGYGLINSSNSVPEVYVRGNRVNVGLQDSYGERLEIYQMPAGQSGAATIEVRTDHGTATGIYTFEPEPRTPFAVESDTLLLWRFDSLCGETGCDPTDSGPLGLEYTEENSSPGFPGSFGSYGIQYQPGRFGYGVSHPRLNAMDDGGALAFGADGFTTEMWVKTDSNTGTVNQAYTLAGKENKQGQASEFALTMLPNGSLRAHLYNDAGNVWEAVTSPDIVNVADGAWHSLAMVVERGNEAGQNRLLIYVDGQERAATLAPEGFGAMRSGSERFSVGHSDTDGPGYTGYEGFPGVVDEVRLSGTAHSPLTIQRAFDPSGLGPVITTVTPANFERGSSQNVLVTGYNLFDLTATVTKPDGSPVPVTVSINGTKGITANLYIEIGSDTPLGELTLRLTSGEQTSTASLRVVAPKPFAVEPTTSLLWHLDEDPYASNVILDASSNHINGTATGWGTSGRFGGTRYNAHYDADPDNDVLAYGDRSFTAECWISVPSARYSWDRITGTYTLIGRENEQGQASDFALSLLPSGALRAQVYDTSGVVWQTIMKPHVRPLKDSGWHLVTMTVDRASDRLNIYVDGELRASTPAPAGFGAMRNGGVLRAGRLDADGPTTDAYADEVFPGRIDEIHLLAHARTAADVLKLWTGGNSSSTPGKPIGSVRGRILAGDAQTPVTSSNVNVEIFDVATGQQLASNQANSSDGSYRFEDVDAGAQGFRIVAHSPFDQAVTVEATRAITIPGEVLEVDLSLPISVVRGAATFADGAPLAYPSVYLTQRDATGALNTFYATSNDEQGGFVVLGAATGEFALTIQDSQSGLSATANGNVADVAVPVTVNVMLQPTGTVTGTIRRKDATGNLVTVANARVYLTTDGAFQRSATTDGEGLFTFERIALKAFNLRAEAPDGEGLFGEASGTLVNANDTAVSDITLPETATLSGKVFRADGTTPFAYVSVAVSSPGLAHSRTTYTNAAGAYSFTRMPLDDFALQSVGYLSGANVFGSTGGALSVPNSTATVNIAMLATATVSGKVLRADGAAAAGAQISVQGFGGGGSLGFYEQSYTADAAGNYTATNVPIGVVRVTARAADDIGFAQGNVVTNANLTALDVTLGNAVALDAGFKLDGMDGFRYEFFQGGLINQGGLIGGGIAPFNSSFDLTLNDGDYFSWYGGDSAPRLIAASTEDEGREIVIGQTGMDNLLLTRKIFSPVSGGFARYLEIISNPTARDITVNVKLKSDLTAGSGTRVAVAPAATGNTFAVVANADEESTAALAFVFGNTGARVAVRKASFTDGDGYPFVNARVTIPAGETRILMHFVAQRAANDSLAARTQAETLANLSDPLALNGMSTDELRQVANFNVPPELITRNEIKLRQRKTPSDALGGASSSAIRGSTRNPAPAAGFQGDNARRANETKHATLRSTEVGADLR